MFAAIARGRPRVAGRLAALSKLTDSRRSISSLCRSRNVEAMSSFISIGSCLTSPFFSMPRRRWITSPARSSSAIMSSNMLPISDRDLLHSGLWSPCQSAHRAPQAIAGTCRARFDPSSFVRRRGKVSIASASGFRPNEAVETLRKCLGAMPLRLVLDHGPTGIGPRSNRHGHFLGRSCHTKTSIVMSAS